MHISPPNPEICGMSLHQWRKEMPEENRGHKQAKIEFLINYQAKDHV